MTVAQQQKRNVPQQDGGEAWSAALKDTAGTPSRHRNSRHSESDLGPGRKHKSEDCRQALPRRVNRQDLPLYEATTLPILSADDSAGLIIVRDVVAYRDSPAGTFQGRQQNFFFFRFWFNGVWKNGRRYGRGFGWEDLDGGFDVGRGSAASLVPASVYRLDRYSTIGGGATDSYDLTWDRRLRHRGRGHRVEVDVEVDVE